MPAAFIRCHVLCLGGVMHIPGGGPVRGGSRLTEEHEAFSLK